MDMISSLNIDVETFSTVNLKTSGVHKYVKGKGFKILLFGYSVESPDYGCLDLIDLANYEKMPDRVFEWLIDPKIIKRAWSAGFEFNCIEEYFKIKLDLSQWECTMSKAALYGYPLKLEKTAEILLDEDHQKDTKGKALIKLFTVPNKEGKQVFGDGKNAVKWEQFKTYCKQDVVVEKGVGKKLESFPFPESEKEIWHYDQIINNRGVMVDKKLIHQAISMNDIYQTRMTARAIELTGLENPNSLSQLKAWLTEEEPGENFKKLDKESIANMLLPMGNIESDVALEVLKIRQKMGKTSVGKYYTMLEYLMDDGRIRGQFQYFGAGTGRWAGRGTQPHNLPKNYLKTLAFARGLLSAGKMDQLETLYDLPATLSELIRTAFIPGVGRKLVIGDFSQIEARIISWIAKEKWRLETFRAGIDIYTASGASMFKKRLDEVGKGTILREKAKIAELALGYQGGVGALAKMGGAKLGLSEDEMQEIVWAWREANPKIKQLWYAVGNAALACVQNNERTSTHGLAFFMVKDTLFIRIHSGRLLSYPQPRIINGKYGPALAYHGLIEANKKWGLIPTYGGKLVENIVQAEARDLLAAAIVNLEKAGYEVVLHVHDEAVIEILKYINCIKDIERIMEIVPAWAEGLPMKADVFENHFYKKE